ncbi:phosphotransferase, partial [Robertmurraya sp. Marseille-Q9965]
MELMDINEIASRYGIEAKDYEPLSERATLIIAVDGEKLVLKKKESIEKIKSEFKLLKHLQNNDILTQYPIINRVDEYITPYQNNNYCIYNFLDGKPFSCVESLHNSKVPKLLAETIANMNKAMKTINFMEEFPTKDLYKMVYDFAVYEITKVDKSEKLIKIYQELERDIKTAIRNLPKQIVHRDAHIHNILFKDDIL